MLRTKKEFSAILLFMFLLSFSLMFYIYHSLIRDLNVERELKDTKHQLAVMEELYKHATRDKRYLQNLYDNTKYLTDNMINSDIEEDEIVNANKKLKILFLTTEFAYQVMMDRHFYFIYDAAKRHPLVEATMWGRDMEGWDRSYKAYENIEIRFGKDYFDVVQVWGGFGPQEIVPISAGRTQVAYRFGCECWDHRCDKELLAWNASIAQFCYANEMEMYTKFSHKKVFVHSPNAADPYYFLAPEHTLKSEKRDINALLIGSAGSHVYPLRARLKSLIGEGKIAGGVVRQHPGYTDHFTRAEIREHNITVDWQNRQLRDYADQMARSKIIFVTSSIYKYSLQKYAEAALSGALIMGEIPLERETEYSKFIVKIDPNMSDDELISFVKFWVDNTKERERRAYLGQQITLRKYTWKNTVDTIIESYRRLLRQQYGLWYRHPFSVGCQAKNVSSRVNEWCTNNDSETTNWG